MFDFHRLAIIGAVLSGIMVMPPVRASVTELSGAWATDADLCSHVFAKKGNGVVFAELSDLFGSGFIIEGNRIRGKSARCTITSRKQDGDNLDLGAACATGIMNQNVRFSLKLIDDSHLTRLFPDIQGMTLQYTRCSL
jgi:hypothetical protein